MTLYHAFPRAVSRIVPWCLVLCLFISSPVPGAERICITAHSQWELAQSLEREGAAASAAHEFVRFYHLFPGHPKDDEARHRAGLCFFKAGMLSDAQRQLSALATHYKDDNFAPRAMVALSRVHRAQGNPGRGVLVLKNLLTLSRDPELREKTCARLAWSLIEDAPTLEGSPNPNGMDPLAQALKYLGQIPPENLKKYGFTQKMVEELGAMDQMETKDPTLAGLAALIPGAGFAYTGRYRDGLIAFLWNTALGLSAFQAFDNHQEYLGGILTFVELGFYAGNIYGSMASAHKYNQKKRREKINQFKREGFKFFPRLGRGETALFFSHSF